MEMACSKQGVLPIFLGKKVGLWAVVALGGFLMGCTSPPQLHHPAGKSKQTIPGNPEAAARYQALQLGVPPPLPPIVLAHDADDVKALSDQLEQLKLQINQAQRGPVVDTSKSTVSRPLVPNNKPLNKEVVPLAQSPAPPVAPLAVGTAAPVWVAPAKRFEVTAKDNTLLGVVVRWAELNTWRVQINGALLQAGVFPSHSVAYADIALAAAAKGVGADELEEALGALLEAHQHFQERLVFKVALKAAVQEMQIRSELIAETPRSLAP